MANIPERIPKGHRTIACQAVLVRSEGEQAPAADAPIQIAISSEEPVTRWGATEILDHSPSSIDMRFAERGMAFLVGHDSSEENRLQVGIVRNWSVGKDRVLRGDVYFSSDEEAQRIRQDIVDGIRPYISVGYTVQEYLVENAGKPNETYRATMWTPCEASTVAVPADSTVGIGRAEQELHPVTVRRSADAAAIPTTKENRQMADPIKNDKTEEQRSAQAAADAEALASARIASRNKEVAEIVQLATSHGQAERAAEFIAEGLTPDQAARKILESRGAGAPVRQPAGESAPTMFNIQTEKSRKPVYSVVRALAGAVARADGGRWEGYESEVDQDIRSKLPVAYKQRGGVFIPERQGETSPEVRREMARMLGLKTRAGLDSASANAGAELVFDTPGDFIDLLRNMPVVTQMGATVLSGLGGPVTFPKQTAAGSASWVGENPGSDVSDSDMDTSTIALSPKTLQSSTSYSRQLLAQASFDVEALVRADLAKIHALAIDKAAIHGSGTSNEPTGIYAASGVNSKAMGGAVAFGELVDMATEVALDNALMGSTGFVTNPGMAGKLMQVLEADAAGARMIWTGTHAEGRVAGYRAVSTNQVSKTMSGSDATGGSSYGIVFGNWADLYIGTWGALEIIVDPYSKKKQGMIEVTSFQLADILLRHGESFCKATGATLA